MKTCSMRCSTVMPKLLVPLLLLSAVLAQGQPSTRAPPSLSNSSPPLQSLGNPPVPARKTPPPMPTQTALATPPVVRLPPTTAAGPPMPSPAASRQLPPPPLQAQQGPSAPAGALASSGVRYCDQRSKSISLEPCYMPPSSGWPSHQCIMHASIWSASLVSKAVPQCKQIKGWQPAVRQQGSRVHAPSYCGASGICMCTSDRCTDA